MNTLVRSDIPGLDPLFRGKVRDVYDLGEHLLLVASDRISAFDVVLPTPIPDKGRVLTGLSNFWFDKTSAIMPNHLTDLALDTVTDDRRALAQLADRSVIVCKAEALAIEAIVRGYLAGSAWAEYQKTGAVCGIKLAPGLCESERLPEPIFTPSTKAPRGQHDENIDFARAAELIGPERAELVKETSLALYRMAVTVAEERGIIVGDTKFEFGMRDGEMILIDELLTPDSSRFWDVETYEPGRSQPSFDKQFVRDYLATVGWDRRPPAPELPSEIVERTSHKYREAYRRLVGQVPGWSATGSTE